jgi:hypothetical protein
MPPNGNARTYLQEVAERTTEGARLMPKWLWPPATKESTILARTGRAIHVLSMILAFAFVTVRALHLLGYETRYFFNYFDQFQEAGYVSVSYTMEIAQTLLVAAIIVVVGRGLRYVLANE